MEQYEPEAGRRDVVSVVMVLHFLERDFKYYLGDLLWLILGIPQKYHCGTAEVPFSILQKKFGQNFLIRHNGSGPDYFFSGDQRRRSCVPGDRAGASLPHESQICLWERAGSVVAVEIDKALNPSLEKTITGL